MLIGDIIAAFVIASLFIFILTTFFGREEIPRDGSGSGKLFIFLLFFLGIWAGGLWAPFGPTIYDVHWISFAFSGFLLFLLLAAFIPPRAPRQPLEESVTPTEAMREEQKRFEEEDQAVSTAFSSFFWILMIFLITSIILGYQE